MFLIRLLVIIFCINTICINNIAVAGIKKYESLEYVNDDIPIFNEEGKEVYLDNFNSKVILVVFWATWCAACIEDMPKLDILQKDFSKLPFEIVAISEDFVSIDNIKEFYKNANLRHIKIYYDQNNKLLKEFGTPGLPVAFLITTNSKIAVRFTGNTMWHRKEIRDIILEYIPGPFEEPRNSHKENK